VDYRLLLLWASVLALRLLLLALLLVLVLLLLLMRLLLLVPGPTHFEGIHLLT